MLLRFLLAQGSRWVLLLHVVHFQVLLPHLELWAVSCPRRHNVKRSSALSERRYLSDPSQLRKELRATSQSTGCGKYKSSKNDRDRMRDVATFCKSIP